VILDASFSKNELRGFCNASASVGRDKYLVQGAGGNTSIKSKTEMFVKASGKLLSSALKEEIFVKLNLAKVREKIACNDMDLASGAEGLRPSIETTLHALLPQKYVFHLHCVRTLSWVVQSDFDILVANRLTGVDWAYIPYVKPGLDLTKKIMQMLEDRTPPEVVLLGNHGLVVSGDSLDRVMFLIRDIGRRLDVGIRPHAQPDLTALSKLSFDTLYEPSESNLAHQLALDDDNFLVSSGGSLYPDHVVFLGPGVATVNNREELLNLLDSLPKEMPYPAVLAKGKGVLLPKEANTSVLQMVEALALVVERIPAEAKINYLNKQEELDLIFWEAESYRRSIK